MSPLPFDNRAPDRHFRFHNDSIMQNESISQHKGSNEPARPENLVPQTHATIMDRAQLIQKIKAGELPTRNIDRDVGRKEISKLVCDLRLLFIGLYFSLFCGWTSRR